MQIARTIVPSRIPALCYRPQQTGAFADEHDELVHKATALATPVVDLVVGARNHVDLPFGLDDPADVLGRAAFAQMSLPIPAPAPRG